MAEATLAAVETEVTPPNDATLATPDATTETVTQPDDQQEDTSHIDAFLEGLGTEEAGTEGADGKDAATDGEVPLAEQKPQTEAEIREDERRKLTQQANSQKNSEEYRNRVTSLNWVAREDVPAKLTALAEKYGMQATDVTELFTQVNRLHGALKPVLEYELEQQKPQIVNEAATEMQKQVATLMYEAVKEDLGEPSLTALQSGGIKTWQDFTKAIVKEARKGYVPESDYVPRAAVGKRIDKYEKAIAERGSAGIVTRSLKELDGTGGQDLPSARGGNSRQGTKEWAESASIEELLLDKARRSASG